MTRRTAPNKHDPNCSWHLDQYDHECACGRSAWERQNPPGADGMTRDRDIDAALETAAACRVEASPIRQTGIFAEYARWLLENARAAERWAVKRVLP
jgi:hypothetical protein